MFHILKAKFTDVQVTSPKARDRAGIPSPVWKHLVPVYLLRTIPCCSTAGVAWRPPHPPQAGSACPGTPLFPPQRQLGRSNPKPGRRPGISSLSPQVTDQVRGQYCLSQACEIFPRADHTMQLQSHPFPKEAELGKDASSVPPPFQRKRSQTTRKEMREGLTLCPSPMTR